MQISIRKVQTSENTTENEKNLSLDFLFEEVQGLNYHALPPTKYLFYNAFDN